MTLDGIPLNLVDVGGWGAFVVLATAAVLGFMRGLIFPRAAVEAEKARADTWQEAWTVERAANREKDAMLSEVLEHSRTSAHALEEIQDSLQRGGRP